MKKEFDEKLKRELNKINIIINNEEINMFYEYMTLLLTWNEKINLTAITEQNEIILKHFVDCLTILEYINERESVLDIGTGAGFPGIPLAIMCPNNQFTLVDSLNKRINFLNEVKDTINLKNIVTIHTRAEEFGQNKIYREQFDVVVSRAVANLNVLVEYLLPCVKIGGKIICMKGSQVEDEIESAQVAIRELGGIISERKEFYLADTSMKRNLIIINKINNTPQKYPRKAGMPSKQPIK